MKSKERMGDQLQSVDNKLDPVDSMLQLLSDKGFDIFHADDNMSLSEYQEIIRKGWAKSHINQARHEIMIELTDAGKKEAKAREFDKDEIMKFPLPLYDAVSRYGEDVVREQYMIMEVAKSDWDKMSEEDRVTALKSSGFDVPSFAKRDWNALPSETQLNLGYVNESEAISGPPADTQPQANIVQKEEERKRLGGLTIANSGHRSTYSDSNKAKYHKVEGKSAENIVFDEVTYKEMREALIKEDIKNLMRQLTETDDLTAKYWNGLDEESRKPILQDAYATDDVANYEDILKLRWEQVDDYSKGIYATAMKRIGVVGQSKNEFEYPMSDDAPKMREQEGQESDDVERRQAELTGIFIQNDRKNSGKSKLSNEELINRIVGQGYSRKIATDAVSYIGESNKKKEIPMNAGHVDVHKVSKNKTIITPAEEALRITINNIPENEVKDFVKLINTHGAFAEPGKTSAEVSIGPGNEDQWRIFLRLVKQMPSHSRYNFDRNYGFESATEGNVRHTRTGKTVPRSVSVKTTTQEFLRFIHVNTKPGPPGKSACPICRPLHRRIFEVTDRNRPVIPRLEPEKTKGYKFTHPGCECRWEPGPPLRSFFICLISSRSSSLVYSLARDSFTGYFFLLRSASSTIDLLH